MSSKHTNKLNRPRPQPPSQPRVSVIVGCCRNKAAMAGAAAAGAAQAAGRWGVGRVVGTALAGALGAGGLTAFYYRCVCTALWVVGGLMRAMRCVADEANNNGRPGGPSCTPECLCVGGRLDSRYAPCGWIDGLDSSVDIDSLACHAPADDHKHNTPHPTHL